MTLPSNWTPPAPMRRVICHWTAGAHKAGAVDRRAYHILVEGDGNVVRGDHPISANVPPLKSGGYAAHVRGLNSYSIGVSLCAMAGARERPFNAGRFPITQLQWTRMLGVVADLCRRYRIPVTRETVLTHAEVEPVLGIRQASKWDIAVLPFAPAYNTPQKVGDLMRREIGMLL